MWPDDVPIPFAENDMSKPEVAVEAKPVAEHKLIITSPVELTVRTDGNLWIEQTQLLDCTKQDIAVDQPSV